MVDEAIEIAWYGWSLAALGVFALTMWRLRAGRSRSRIGAIGSKRFEAAQKQLADDDSEVLVTLGCLGSEKPLREVDLPELCPHVRAEGLQWAMAEMGQVLEPRWRNRW